MRTLSLVLLTAGLCFAGSKPKVHTFQADEATVWSAVKTVVAREYTLVHKDEALKTLAAEYSVRSGPYRIGISVEGSEVSMRFTEMQDVVYKWGSQGRIAKKFFADVSAQLAKPR